MFTKVNFLRLSIVSSLLLLGATGCETQKLVAQEQQAPQGEVGALEMAEQAGALAQITAVRLNPTPNRQEVILETAGTFAEVLTSSSENSLITDIPNAQLRLPQGKAFRQDNPIQDIASVEATNLDARTIRVTVTGKAGVPTAEVSQSPQALILSVAAAPEQQTAPLAAPAQEAKEETPLELTVTAEEAAGGYNIPDATTATGTVK